MEKMTSSHAELYKGRPELLVHKETPVHLVYQAYQVTMELAAWPMVGTVEFMERQDYPDQKVIGGPWDLQGLQVWMDG